MKLTIGSSTAINQTIIGLIYGAIESLILVNEIRGVEWTDLVARQETAIPAFGSDFRDCRVSRESGFQGFLR